MNAGGESFEIIAELGRGGMGIVYKANQVSMHRTVALKILTGSAVYDHKSQQRLLREGRSCASLNHPNIVKLYLPGTSNDGSLFLVMEYVEGRTLEQVLLENKTLDTKTFVQIFDQILSALACAHEQGIVHRDLKPTNIMITEGGIAKLMDFGIAKNISSDFSQQALTQTGALVGSPWYMSPEQCTGGVIDSRSDLYSLGCIMYESICGKRPFDGDNALEVMYKHLHEQLSTTTELSLPMFSAVICKAMAKDPNMRYSSAEEMKEDLHCQQTKTTHILRTSRKQMAKRQKRLPGLALAAVCLSLLVSVAARYISNTKPPQLVEHVSPRHLFDCGIAELGKSMHSSGAVALEHRNKARNFYQRAADLARRLDEPACEADALCSLAQMMDANEWEKNGDARYRQVINLYYKARPQAPGLPTCLCFLTDWYLHHGRPQQAIETAKETIAAAKLTINHDGDYFTRLAHLRWADACGRIGSTEEAFVHFNQAIAPGPDTTPGTQGRMQALRTYAEWLQQNGFYKESNAQLTQLLELYRENDQDSGNLDVPMPAGQATIASRLAGLQQMIDSNNAKLVVNNKHTVSHTKN